MKVEYQGWAIIEPKGKIRFGVHYTRKEAVYSLIRGTKYTWKEARKYGWRVVKVGVFKIGPF